MAKRFNVNVDFDKNASVFGLIVIAVAVFAIGAVVAKTLVDVAQYNGRIISKRNEVQAVISSNLDNRDALLENYAQLPNQSIGPDVLFQIVSTDYDFAGFTSIANTIAESSGVGLESISSNSETESVNAISRELETTPQPFEVTIQITGDYDAIRQFITNMQVAAQPIEINSMEISGEAGNLRADFQITSYYQQRIGIDAGEETVR